MKPFVEKLLIAQSGSQSRRQFGFTRISNILGFFFNIFRCGCISVLNPVSRPVSLSYSQGTEVHPHPLNLRLASLNLNCSIFSSFKEALCTRIIHSTECHFNIVFLSQRRKEAFSFLTLFFIDRNKVNHELLFCASLSRNLYVWT